MRRLSTTRGFSLVEVLIYIGILTVVFLVITSTLLSFISSYRVLLALRAVEHSATESLERMTRDIRNAATVDDINSVLTTHPGILTIVSQGNTSTTTKFYIQNGVLKVDVNGAYVGPLTTRDAVVTNLVFRHLISPHSHAVKIDITLQATHGSVTETKTYQATTVLKGS